MSNCCNKCIDKDKCTKSRFITCCSSTPSNNYSVNECCTVDKKCPQVPTHKFSLGPKGPKGDRGPAGPVGPVGPGARPTASAHIDGIATTPVVTRSYNDINGAPVTVMKLATGWYEIDFGVDLTNSFYQATLGVETGSGIGAAFKGGICADPRSGVPTAIFVRTYDVDGIDIDNSFYLTVHYNAAP